MKILAFDVTLAACSVALWQDGQAVFSKIEPQDRGQAQTLIPAIEQAMKQAGWTYDQLNAIGVTTGPGGFTGVRIGLSTARGFGLALKKPVIGISTFDALAHGITTQELAGRKLAVAIDSRRGDIFVQMYDTDLNPIKKPFITGENAPFPEEYKTRPLLIAGDAASQLAQRTETQDCTVLEKHIFPDPTVIAKLTAERLPLADRFPPVPLYLREADVSQPKHPAGRV